MIHMIKLKKQIMLKFTKVKLMLFMSFFGMLSVMAQTQAQSKAVTDEELKQFVTIFTKVQMENQKIQQDMLKVVEENGLTPQRFQKIQQAQANPNSTAEVSAEEKKSYDAVMSVLKEMQPEFEAKMLKIVTENGFSEERYTEVAQQIQTDPALQQKLQSIMMAGQGAQPAPQN